MSLRSCLWAALAMAAAWPSGAAPASSAPWTAAFADSNAPSAPDSVGGYLRALADSTDRYFGEAASPVDTAGLDSALAAGIAHPPRPRRERVLPGVGPWFSFDRADGALWGGSIGIGEAERRGRLSGRYGYAAGPNAARWGTRYQKLWEGRARAGSRRRSGGLTEDAPRWTLDLSGGRLSTKLDPDYPSSFFRLLRALLNGGDRNHYFLREGFRVGVERETGTWRFGLAFRDEIESPLVTTTTWNLLRKEPEIVFNQPAASGRASEVRGDLAVRVPRLSLHGEGSVAVAADALGSDFEYTRSRVAFGAERPVGDIASFVPQLEYGRLTGDAIPQASFYLGGSHSLRSLPQASLGGTVKGLARLDLFFPQDLLSLAHIPHPALLPISAALFSAVGAVAGADPYGGPPVAGSSWPDRDAWHSEAGVSLLWRPGIPDPLRSFRLDWAWRLGADGGRRVSLEYSAPLDLLRPFTYE